MTDSTTPTPTPTHTEREQDTGWRAPSRPGGFTRKAAVGIAATAVLGGGLALAPSASAAPTASSSTARTTDVSPQGTAPACVQRRVSGRSATVTNYCGRTMRVKVVIKYGPDSRCFTLPPRNGVRFTWLIGRYDKTVTC
ncbi:hypothetical protein [Streptomyces sp. NPDC127108]|uniref:hypothetical protein n=1 Tax=Streptomyces sp. NPDC127108 TaxID=3345361 RepID=UPI00363CF345